VERLSPNHVPTGVEELLDASLNDALGLGRRGDRDDLLLEQLVEDDLLEVVQLLSCFQEVEPEQPLRALAEGLAVGVFARCGGLRLPDCLN